MDRYLEPIKDFFRRFKRKTGATGAGWYRDARRYIRKIFESKSRTKPEKMWCFYWDPYRQGITATVLTGLGVSAIILTILAVIGVITLIVYIAGVIVYLLGLGLILGGVLGGGRIGGSSSDDEAWKGALTGAGVGGYLGFIASEYVFEFGKSVWSTAAAFSENLSLFFIVTTFIKSNWLILLGIVLFPAFMVFIISILTMASVYLLRFVEQAFMSIYGIRNPCPECAQKTEPAIYFCKTCGEKHPHHLVPSKYGVFKHNCINGHELPTMLFLGRNREMPHNCPNTMCSADLSSGAVGTDKHIAFVGGKSSGKTCLLVQVTKELMKRGATIPEPEQQRDFQILENRIDKGEVPDKTSPKNIYRAFQMLFGNRTYPYHLHMYDLAGEKFEHAQDAAAHRFFTLIDSIVFVFDPFSVADFRKAQSLPSGLGMANQDPLEVIRNLCQVLERYNSKTRMRKIALSVLMVKSDVGYLEKLIPSNTDQKQLNNRIKDFIIQDLQQGAFVQHIEQVFSNINYYRISALGRIPDTNDSSPFVSQHLTPTFNGIWQSIRMKVN